MKVLLNENLPHSLRSHLLPHDVRTAVHMGWGGLQNGMLLDVAENEGFEVLVTGDRNLKLPAKFAGTIALVVLTAISHAALAAHGEQIAAAVSRALPGSFEVVTC